VDGLAVSDFPPTDAQLEVHAQLAEQLRAERARLDEIVATDVKAFNELLEAKGVASVGLDRP
jgi:hypothetical protein